MFPQTKLHCLGKVLSGVTAVVMGLANRTGG